MGLGHMSEIGAGGNNRRDMAEAERDTEQSGLLAWEKILAAGHHDGSSEASHGLRI